MKAVVDNDIIYKGVCYGILGAFLFGIPAEAPTVGVLGAARYVLHKKIKRATLNGDKGQIQSALEQFLDVAQEIETTEEEMRIAADLEYVAKRLHLRLDVGESQLCAVMLLRAIPRLATGDKNAIAALARMAADNHSVTSLRGRIICLEQIVLALTNSDSWSGLRDAICAEPRVDTSLRSVMGCTNPNNETKDVVDGLNSYINALRTRAPGMLCRNMATISEIPRTDF